MPKAGNFHTTATFSHSGHQLGVSGVSTLYLNTSSKYNARGFYRCFFGAGLWIAYVSCGLRILSCSLRHLYAGLSGLYGHKRDKASRHELDVIVIQYVLIIPRLSECQVELYNNRRQKMQTIHSLKRLTFFSNVVHDRYLFIAFREKKLPMHESSQ